MNLPKTLPSPAGPWGSPCDLDSRTVSRAGGRDEVAMPDDDFPDSGAHPGVLLDPPMVVLDEEPEPKAVAQTAGTIREMAEEHTWKDAGEEFLISPVTRRYREGDEWRSADPDWMERYVRYELLRVVKQRDELADALEVLLAIVYQGSFPTRWQDRVRTAEAAATAALAKAGRS